MELLYAIGVDMGDWGLEAGQKRIWVAARNDQKDYQTAKDGLLTRLSRSFLKTVHD